MASKSKGPRKTIKLKSTESTYVYYTKINSRNQAEKGGKFKIKKFDPIVKKHVEFIEGSSVNK